MITSRDFAILMHGDQPYGGDKPYVYHLDHVVDILRNYGFTDQLYVDSGYLHDVLEDCPDTSYEEILKLFGQEVADIVRACSGFGENRKARTAMIYNNICDFPDAAIVKAADRISNTQNARFNLRRLYQMYKKEMPAFVEIVRPHIPEAMLQRLLEL